MIAALDGVFVGENLEGAKSLLGKSQPAIFRQMPAQQWKQPSGLIITVLTARDGSITLVDETAAAGIQAVGLVDEDMRETYVTFNQDSHVNVGSVLTAPVTGGCKSSFGADCWLYHYDRGVVLRADFAANGSANGLLREVTLAQPALLQALHFDQ